MSPSDLQALYERAVAAGKPLPVSFVVGSWPIDLVAATMRVPVDELGLVAILRDAPLAGGQVRHQRHPRAGRRRVGDRGLSRRAGHVEPEGPYGEFLGYYGALKRNPVFHVTAITRRHDALFQTATIGGRHMATPTPRSSRRCAPR